MNAIQRILLPLVLLAGCMAPGPVELETFGATGRQVTRVLERHDAYVHAELLQLNRFSQAQTMEPQPDHLMRALTESDQVRGLMDAPTVLAPVLASVLEPVMDRHDAYVQADATLDDLERPSYLGTTAGLRRLLNAGK